MGNWFKLCDITAVSEYHLYNVGDIGLNCVIIEFLANVICSV